MGHEITPFERICRKSPAGIEFWSSRDFFHVLGYTDYRNFEAVVEKARTACFNSGQRMEDHFVEITKMIEIGKDWNVRSRRGLWRTSPRRERQRWSALPGVTIMTWRT